MNAGPGVNVLRDEDLLRIAYSDENDGFEDDVVRAAKIEVDRRGIAQDFIESAQSEIEEERHERELKSTERLGVLGCILYFILAGFFPAWLSTGILKFKGYDQKFKDAWRQILYGFAVYAFIAIGLAVTH